ncbi:MAG TPA: hypothetical protein VN829_00845 [Dongiaceae bacterium]|nr:hypothetical protein [Dongiaceae bacterium]
MAAVGAGNNHLGGSKQGSDRRPKPRPSSRTQGATTKILKVISREPAGRRELNDPRVQQNIREMLLNRKTQLLQSAYIEVARDQAKIENFLARSIVENAGKGK